MMDDVRQASGGVDMTQVSDDAFLGRRVRALQPAQGYRAGLDAVLLAAAAPVCNGSCGRLLDAGAGAGVVGLCIAARIPDTRITMVEFAAELAALARVNVQLNGWGKRIDVIEGDLTGPMQDLKRAGLEPSCYDHVLANPPFHTEGRGSGARDPLKAGAHAMADGGLERWLRFLAAAAKPGGSMSVIHRATEIGALLAACEGRFGALTVLPIHPRRAEPAGRVIVQGIKGSRAPLRLLPGFILHGPGNAFLPEAEAILRAGEALAMD